MDKHTPGPWKHIPWHVAEGYAQVRAPEGWLICETSSEANARLIASAPDLLKALESIAAMQGDYTPEYFMRHSLGIASAAIASAKAEERRDS